MAPPDPESFDPAATRTSHAPVRITPSQPTARESIHRRLSAQARRFPDLDITPLDTAGLEARDAALAHAIYDAVIRRWLTLEFLLNTRLTKPMRELEPKLQGVLLAGAAQLLLHDRIPDHAILNESVEWAKRAIRPGAGAMVNAVLRKVAALRAGQRRDKWTDLRDELPLSDGSALALTESILPESAPERFSVATSHPRYLIDRWAAAHGPDLTKSLALHGLIQPPTILNTRHARTPLPTDILSPHQVKHHHVFTGDRSALIDLLASRDDLWVQDPASTAAIQGVADLRPRIIADACAGQGTKTRQLAATFPQSEIVATDLDQTRLSILRDTFRSRPQVTVTTLADLRAKWAGRINLLLLDVPCSNTGVLARRAEARYRIVPDSLERLVSAQKQIIADSIPLLAPGGAILYSTCSLEREENDNQAVWARRWHHYRIDRSRTLPPAGRPGGDPATYTDGSFSCLLQT